VSFRCSIPEIPVVAYQYCTLGKEFVPCEPLVKQGRFRVGS
jgi:hypothetical protein